MHGMGERERQLRNTNSHPRQEDAMFSLRIRLIVDRLRPEGNKEDPRIRESRGIVHLYRPISRHPGPLPAGRTTQLFVLAVPSRMTALDFVYFCFSHVKQLTAIELIRNDAVDDHYSILIKLDNQTGADSFYCNFNGRRFPSSEAEICHILFIDSVEYTELSEIESAPPKGLTELPTCPVCLERLDQDTGGILTTLCDHSFQCPCISKRTDSSCPVCQFFLQQAEKPTCFVCETSENIWICIICGFAGCGRYQARHAIRHWKDTQHCYMLGLVTKRVWDHVGERFVDRLNQSKSDGKLVELNSHCRSIGEDDCGTRECSDDSGISGSLFSSKVDAIVDGYNHLLATQLENQRQHFEYLLAEAKAKQEKSISEAVESAVSSKLQDIQDKLEKCIKDQKVVADINENLVKNQDLWSKKFIEIEERMSSFNTICSECTPKCLCGAGDMKLYTPRTQLNPNRKFWKCPNWNNENGCGASLWKDEVANWQLVEANSTTCERENWMEEKSNLTAVVEKLESSSCVFIEVEKIRNVYLRRIYHAIIFACCIIILVFLFSQA